METSLSKIARRGSPEAGNERINANFLLMSSKVERPRAGRVNFFARRERFNVFGGKSIMPAPLI